MKLLPQMNAPAFSAKDVFGRQINLLAFKGRKVLLTFYRNVGCPVCNLRFHEIEKNTALFKEKNLQVIAVYESSEENIKQYIETENFYAVMIPDPDLSLYKLYEVERSVIKMAKGIFQGAISKMKEGKQLYKKTIKQDGNADRIGADFLIDENGKILKAYYGQFVGDHLPIEEIKQSLNKLEKIGI